MGAQKKQSRIQQVGNINEYHLSGHLVIPMAVTHQEDVNGHYGGKPTGFFLHVHMAMAPDAGPG